MLGKNKEEAVEKTINTWNVVAKHALWGSSVRFHLNVGLPESVVVWLELAYRVYKLNLCGLVVSWK